MFSLSALIDAYLDVNILLAFACLLWFLTAATMRAAGLAHAYTAQLNALRFNFLVIVFAPLAVTGALVLAERNGLVTDNPMSLSNFIVAQYLQGRFEMDPERLQSVLGVRRQLATGTASGSAAAIMFAAVVMGFAIFAARLIASMWKLRRLLDDSFVWRRFGRLDLRLSDTVTVPFSTRSLTRRIVVLPTSMLAEPDDLKIALGHELQHLRQRDVDWEIGMEILKPFFFWNPAFHLWRRQVEELRELSCDRRVLERKGYDVASYCQCLLRVCHNSLRRRRLFAPQAPVVALVQTESRLFGHRSAQVLRHRMVSLIDGKTERHAGWVATVMLMPIVGLTLLAAISIQNPGDWSQDRLMLSTIINLERLEDMNASSTLKQPSY